MTIRFYLKSGAHIDVQCENIEVKNGPDTDIISYSMKGIPKKHSMNNQNILGLNLNEVVAVTRIN